MILRISLLVAFIWTNSAIAFAEETANAEDSNTSNQLFEADFSQKETRIKSDKLTLQAAERKFIYTGNVELINGEMTITSDQMVGHYSESQELENLIATKDVLIVKGDKIRATGQKAEFENKTRTVLLTGNPEIQQEGSTLSADQIRIFLDEDRSVAEGEVRVKLQEAPTAQKK